MKEQTRTGIRLHSIRARGVLINNCQKLKCKNSRHIDSNLVWALTALQHPDVI